MIVPAILFMVFTDLLQHFMVLRISELRTLSLKFKPICLGHVWDLFPAWFNHILLRKWCIAPPNSKNIIMSLVSRWNININLFHNLIQLNWLVLFNGASTPWKCCQDQEQVWILFAIQKYCKSLGEIRDYKIFLKWFLSHLSWMFFI